MSNNLSLNWNTEISLPKDYFTAQQLSLSPKDNQLLLYKTNQKNLVNDEITKEDNSFGKQIGIYGLEFLGAGIGTAGSGFGGAIALGPELHDQSIIQGLIVYTVGNILITSSCTWITGKLLKQNGSWWKSAAGAGIGTLVGVPVASYLYDWKHEGFMVGVSFVVFFGLPPLGAVAGYNIH